MSESETPSTLNRRDFLRLTGAAATVAAAGTGLEALAGPTTANAQPILIPGTVGPASRASQAYSMRLRAMQLEFAMTSGIVQTPNDDELLYSNYIGNYSKGLPHNSLGEPNAAAYQALLAALASGDAAAFEAIPMGGTDKLTSPQAGLGYAMQGGDVCSFNMPPAPSFRGAEIASEMAENYWMALARDIPFNDYGSNQLIADASTDMSHYSQFKGPKANGQVTPATLFRGTAQGSLTGPYISQFMWLNTPFGAENISRKMRTPVPNVNYLTSYNQWLNIQNGQAPPAGLSFDPVPRYIRNGRDLGEWVHIDVLYQAYFNAMLILFSLGAPMDASNPYNTSQTQKGFSTLGPPYIASVLAAVCKNALEAVWFQKWFVNRHLRPEEFAGRIHNHVTMQTFYKIHTEILDSPVLSRLYNQYGSYLLPMAFPEGCPTHPSYGAGHATVAGACATVLKAFFDESWVIPNPVVASSDGLSLLPYTGGPLTVGGELNKVADNVAIGRNIAGVHWRSDATESVKLGEAVAIRYLMEEKMCLHEVFGGFQLTKFDGTPIVINA